MSKLYFDLIICDTTSPFPYEPQTLRTRGVGGTEASVIRVAEGLASCGLKVAVMQHGLKDILMGTNAYYIPVSMVDEVGCEYYVMLRGAQFVEKFKRAKKFSWHQDVADHRIMAMRDIFLTHDVTVIAASQWHKQEIQGLICSKDAIENPKVTYIYNPVPDSIYVPRNVEVKYYNTKLVWPASPHKGLKRAIDYVNNLVEVSGNKDFRLHVFNPGYFTEEGLHSPYLINHGPVPCHELWQHVSEALCLFYPTDFKETFGCIAAEANAVHTPVLTSELAGLMETVSSRKQYVVSSSAKNVIDTVIKWSNGERPKVWGQDRFRLTNVIKDWARLLDCGVPPEPLVASVDKPNS